MTTRKVNIEIALSRKQSEESKLKNRISHLGKKHKKITKNKISIALKGKKKKLFTEAHLKNLSKSHLGKNGEKASNWRGGKVNNGEGYIMVYLPWHKFARNKKYVLEHRFVMEKHLGRYLQPQEIVHHIDGNTKNNKISNLMLFPTQKAHTNFHHKLRGFKE